ncbi:two-component system response regulator [Betaproteobacteria bacterium]|nr:two-component system response regulator [Betaproteobacteria bacterium]GHU45081.1 two-component system response regulator [Betaproteobacteria bacterium]
MTIEISAAPTVLIVDDVPDNLVLMSSLLKDLYKVKAANSGKKAISIVTSGTPPDLILLDVMMPEMSGYDVCKHLQSLPGIRNIPIIFLTANHESRDEQIGLEMGAVDYITKPIVPAVVLARVATHLQLKASADFLRDKSAFLEAEVIRRTSEIQAIQDVTILMMASLAETRDNETGNHIHRTQRYVRALAQSLSEHPRFRDYLNRDTIELLYKSAPLHDIGKVGVPDRILLKPGKLTADEFEIMKQHAILGYEAIVQAEKQLGKDVGFLACAKEIACSHHEKWDGSGYPYGLVGNDIPISARLMAVADVYDALISRRVYKPAMSHEKASEIIVQGAGKHFDPDVVHAFLALDQEFIAIAARFEDSDADITREIAALETAVGEQINLK